MPTSSSPRGVAKRQGRNSTPNANKVLLNILGQLKAALDDGLCEDSADVHPETSQGAEPRESSLALEAEDNDAIVRPCRSSPVLEVESNNSAFIELREPPNTIRLASRNGDGDRLPIQKTKLFEDNRVARAKIYTLFRQARSVHEKFGADVYVAVRYKKIFLTFNSGNLESLTPLEPREGETTISVAF